HMPAGLFLIAHAPTAAPRASLFPSDEALDEPGMAHATELAGRLPSADICLSAPEQRTQQTSKALGLSPHIEPQLRDCDYGTWAGRAVGEIAASEPKLLENWLSDPAAAPHGGESIVTLIQRASAWLADEQKLDRRIIAVSHPAFIRAAIVSAIEGTPRSFWRIDVSPFSMTRMSGMNGRWNLTSLKKGKGRRLRGDGSER